MPLRGTEEGWGKREAAGRERGVWEWREREARGGVGSEGWTGRAEGQEERSTGGEGRVGGAGDGVTRLTNGQCWQVCA